MDKKGKCNRCKCCIKKPHHRSAESDKLCLNCLDLRLRKLQGSYEKIIKKEIEKVLEKAGETIDE
jgi:hypothetical protein